MADRMKVKPSVVEVLRVLNYNWPGFVTVPTLMHRTKQTDVRKRISEAICAGYDIEKERNGRFVAYRWTS